MTRTPVFYHLGINASRSTRATWGDTQYAEGLGRAITRLTGSDWALLYRGEKPQTDGGRHVVVRIVGPHLEEPVPGLPNILWMISPPNVAPLPMIERHQAVFCASQVLTQRLERLGVACSYLPQVTEPGHFHPEKRPAGTAELPLVFVGGLAVRAVRQIVFDAVAAGFEPQIWGPGWQDAVPAHLWRGERLHYDELAEVYASARIILNSHMPGMAQLGFMSNRSYDALASGAMVISDNVAGFSAPGLPELQIARNRTELTDQLTRMLAAPPLDPAGRLALYQRIADGHTFDVAASAIIAAAERCLADGQATPAAWCPGRQTGLELPVLSNPATSAATPILAMRAAAAEILSLARYLEQPGAPRPSPPQPGGPEGVIHALMADLGELQQIALTGDPVASAPRIQTIAAGAQRIHEALRTRMSPLDFHAPADSAEYLLARIKNNRPLWSHSPEGFDRNNGKRSLRLWAKEGQPGPARGIGVFLHLYYDDLAPVFAQKLEAIRQPYSLYVTTDTDEKAARIAQALPAAEIRVLANRGRDILPKLYGFRDAHDRHDIALHLHGKKSRHSEMLDAWLQHILDCLLGSPQEVNRILSLFETLPQVGIICPLTFRKVLGAAHWGDNLDIARELHRRTGMTTPLPGETDLRFPVGSMFWARTDAIRPLLDLDLQPEHFPPEAGQLDGTLAHAIERMLGVVCQAGGRLVLPVSGMGSGLHARQQLRVSSLGRLRRALEEPDSPF